MGNTCAAEGQKLVTEGTYTLVYHGAVKAFLGRAYGPVLVLEEAKSIYSGITYETKNPDEVVVPVAFAPPMIITPSGAKIAQQAAIMVALGKELGMWPASFAAEAKALQYCMDAADMLQEVVLKKPQERLEKWVNHFGKALVANPEGRFLVGTTLTSADYQVLAALVQLLAAYSSITVPDNLASWMTMMKEQNGFKRVEAMNLPLFPPSSK